MARRTGMLLVCGGVVLFFLLRSAIDVHPMEAEQGSDEFTAAVDRLTRKCMRRHHIPGLSIGVVRGGSIEILRGYGQADRAQRIPATADTVFRAYSLAKIFTAFETIRLCTEGLVDLDSPVAEVLSEWEVPTRWQESDPVTIRHLLCHRSGLPRNSNYHESLAVARTAALLRQVESIRSAWAAFPTGHRYKYSNVGYNVLGRIIENVRDELFAVYMTESALPEYGMDHSAFLIDFLPTHSIVATGYKHHWGRYRPYAAQDIIQLASGNLYTTTADLSKFMIKALSEPSPDGPFPLDRDRLASMYVPQRSTPADPQRNGLGWMTSEEFMGELMVWDQGGDFDANALVAMLPDSGTGVAILTNSGSFDGSALLILASQIMKILREKPLIRNASSRDPESAVAGRPDPVVAGLSVSSSWARKAVPGRYVVYGEMVQVRDGDRGLRLDFGPITFRLELEAVRDLGAEYSLHHWVAGLGVGGRLPVDLSLVRLIIPMHEPSITEEAAGDGTDHMVIAVSDLSYEICPRYPDMSEIPARCAVLVGEYDNCEVTFVDNALRMTGVGYLVERDPGILTVVGGLYDGETVVVDPVSTSLWHQGFEYRKAIP